MEGLKRWAARIFMMMVVALIASALAYSLPLDFAFLMAVDMTAYFEALFGVYLISQGARWRVVVGTARTRLLALTVRMLGAPRRRERRSIRTRVERKPQADNDDGPALVTVAA
jgi:hypothetical protein